MRRGQKGQHGQRLDDFELLDELGRGGMGVVYRARDVSLDRIVALKVLLPGLSSEAEYVARFKREAKIVAALQHRHIVGILSYGETEGRYYFAMEYVAGRDLGEWIREEGKLSVPEALRITRDVASALDEANSQGITHRDIKPSNIMIDAEGRALLTDFGIARLLVSREELTRTGSFYGTPEYAAPELANGTGADVRSDIYSLGAVLYKCVAGAPPIAGETTLAILAKLSTEGATPLAQTDPTLPAPLCTLVDGMLATDPDARPQTPQELLAAIADCERILAGDEPLGPTIAVSATPPVRRRLPVGAVWMGSALGALLAVLLIVWSVEALMGVLDPPVRLLSGPTPPVGAGGSNEHLGLAVVVEHPPVPLLDTTPPEPELPTAPTPSLPQRPAVLVWAVGDETLVPLVQSQVESSLLGVDVDVIPLAEIPIPRRRLQIGGLRWTWTDVRRLVPSNRAQVVVLARIQKTGSTTLRYYGRVDQMTIASFSIQTFDTASGHSIHSDSAGSIQFTALNMSENLQSAIDPVIDGLGTKIANFWKQKLRASGGANRG
jgi:serine/threonine-protein kinase